MPTKHLLCLSNGHGEDLNTCQILAAFIPLCSEVRTVALPIVGNGEAYRRLGIPIIGPTQSMPSGGIFYMNPLVLLQDLGSGLLRLTWQQLRAIWAVLPECELILATGDIVVVAIAYLTGKPFTAVLVAESAHYEGRLCLSRLLAHCLRSPRCQQIFTRDAFTAEELQRHGFRQAQFVGCPFMDGLHPSGRDLHLHEGSLIALLPGSHLPEVLQNFGLLLRLCEYLAEQSSRLNFRAALVPQLIFSQLEALAISQQWRYQEGKLTKTVPGGEVEVWCYWDAFADILHQADLVIAMAGTAVEQAVGLGKPVITIPGEGPQFTYRFAEAQMRLLGPSVQTIGDRPADEAILRQAAQQIPVLLQDQRYLEVCKQNGLNRVGRAGGSAAIARSLVTHLGEESRS